MQPFQLIQLGSAGVRNGEERTRSQLEDVLAATASAQQNVSRGAASWSAPAPPRPAQARSPVPAGGGGGGDGGGGDGVLDWMWKNATLETGLKVHVATADTAPSAALSSQFDKCFSWTGKQRIVMPALTTCRRRLWPRRLRTPRIHCRARSDSNQLEWQQCRSTGVR